MPFAEASKNVPWCSSLLAEHRLTRLEPEQMGVEEKPHEEERQYEVGTGVEGVMCL